MKDKHRDNMKHIHFRYCEEVSKLQEKPIIDRRSVLFNTPQILLANEKYTIVEVLDEYSQNWSIFKKNLSAFQFKKLNMSDDEDENDLKNWEKQITRSNKRSTSKQF